MLQQYNTCKHQRGVTVVLAYSVQSCRFKADDEMLCLILILCFANKLKSQSVSYSMPQR